ncbi:uncharacterized protein LOC111313301 isoform X2 [Durio zibethinus]|uniref:Uncharacterized protein LOC111313301 isoform X2 n=1 Tax=Durio zibethinus TaxID=66656 RepID=A0A6P6AY38_DURZI|nr:uncharacterized protein LOC111313301 isoform X2 [Durio zibethinus]
METTAANTTVGPKGRKYASEEKEQHSPLSVLDFEYGENSFSSFNQSLAIMERTKQKLMEKIQHLKSLAKVEPVNLEKWMSLEGTGEDGEVDDDDDDEVEEEEETNEVEEKARQLLNRVKGTSSLRICKNICTDKLLLDLFREEIATKWNQTRNEELERDMVRLAKAWIDGEQNETEKWGVGEKKEACVRDMDREGRWSKFLQEEQEDLAWEVESRVMNILVDELLADLL